MLKCTQFHTRYCTGPIEVNPDEFIEGVLAYQSTRLYIMIQAEEWSPKAMRNNSCQWVAIDQIPDNISSTYAFKYFKILPFVGLLKHWLAGQNKGKCRFIYGHRIYLWT